MHAQVRLPPVVLTMSALTSRAQTSPAHTSPAHTSPALTALAQTAPAKTVPTQASPSRLAVAPGSPASFDDPDNWRRRALCLGVGTELFFPAGELGEEPVQQAESAKAVCFECPVRGACLEYALTTDQPFGIWGGTTEAERRSIRRRRRRRPVAS